MEDDADGPMLGGRPDLVLGPVEVGAVEGHVPGRERFQAGEGSQGDGLARTVGAEQGDDLAGGDVQVDVEPDGAAVGRPCGRRGCWSCADATEHPGIPWAWWRVEDGNWQDGGMDRAGLDQLTDDQQQRWTTVLDHQVAALPARAVAVVVDGNDAAVVRCPTWCCHAA